MFAVPMYMYHVLWTVNGSVTTRKFCFAHNGLVLCKSEIGHNALSYGHVISLLIHVIAFSSICRLNKHCDPLD